MGLSSIIIDGQVTNDAGRWVKLTEESLAQYCDKPTAVGYALCYSDAAKKTFLEDEEVSMCACVYTRVCACTCMCIHVCMLVYVCVHTCVYIHVCVYSTCIPALPNYMLRDGTIQASRVLMYHVKSITIQ